MTLSRDRQSALLAAVPALLTVAIIAHHPVVRVSHPGAVDEFVAGVAQLAAWNSAFHALILVLWTMQALGLFAFAERLGLASALVRAGVIFYGVSLTLVMVAGTVDGFVTPVIAEHCATRLETCGAQFGMAFAIIQGATRVGLGAQALAFACWASVYATLFKPRWIGLVGLALAGAAFFVSAPMVTIDPRRLKQIVVFQAAWTGGAAWILWARSRLAGTE